MRIAQTAALLLILALPLMAAGAESCNDALREAQKSYDLGLFEDVPGQLAPCLSGRVSRSVAIDVQSLLARAYLENEEIDKARAAVSAVLRLDSTFEPGPSPRFAALVEDVRREEQTVQVASVSKTNESLREAPATVTVITGEEIQRRGYLDLEQLLHDLPGFDISRVNGQFYSVIYQRGYNAYENDRNLLLVDGVEQNDIAFGTAYLARQYPLSNIDRIEIIYGPAATMYGANAYTGVISIITKAPETVVGEKKSFGLTGHVTGGGYGSGYADMTAAGRDGTGTIAWSVAANYQESKERDLSDQRQWDYTFRRFDYKNKPSLRLPGSPLERSVFCSAPSPYFHCDESGISLTDEGVAYVRGLDSAVTRGQGYLFYDHAKNWSIYGKLRIANLTLGLQTWRSQEGIDSQYFSGGKNSWTPKETALYLKYSLPLSSVKLNVFTRYQQTGLEKNSTEIDFLHGYATGLLTLWSLVPPCKSFLDPIPTSCAPATPWVEKATQGNTSSQIRSEINAVWEPARGMSALAGIDLTKSNVQGGYDETAVGPGQLSTLPYKPELREHTDYAAYGQGSWKPRPSLKIVLAGRLTHDQLNNKPGERGFGTLFTPRAAVVYAPRGKPFVLKAIYSEAFKDPSDFQKHGVEYTFSQAYPSNGLKPEKVKNIEVNAGWESAERFSVEGSVYQARYSNVVGYGFARRPDGSLITECFFGCEQWQNRDEVRIRGLQLTASYKTRRATIWGNYTHTDAAQVNPLDFIGNPLVDASGQRVRKLPSHGIAPNRANLGVSTTLGRLEGGVRVNYVDRRPQGAGTTLLRTFTNDVFNEPLVPVNGRTTADVVFSYHALANATAQLSVLNVLDRQYFDPASSNATQPSVLQAGRTIYLRLIYKLPTSESR